MNNSTKRFIKDLKDYKPESSMYDEKMPIENDANLGGSISNCDKKDQDKGLILLDTVTPEVVKWLWQGYIPLGKITIMDGDPGLGKSTLTVDLAARVSIGDTMPDGTLGITGGVIIVSAEDGLADTIVPRLKAHGADLTRVAALQGVLDERRKGGLRPPTIGDIEEIRKACNKVQATLLIIDPLMAHLDGSINSFRDQDIRRALTPLSLLADETGVAVVLVRHLNKSGGAQAIYRGGGSIGIIGAARCAFIVAKDPEDDNKRVLASIKNNLAKMRPSLSFSLENTETGVAKIKWHGESGYKADALLLCPSSEEEQTVLDEAKTFLKDALANAPVKVQALFKDARGAGISDTALRRAKKALGIMAKKEGFQGAWKWALPFKDVQRCSKMLTNKDEHLWDEVTTFETKEASRPKAIDVQEVLDYDV